MEERRQEIEMPPTESTTGRDASRSGSVLRRIPGWGLVAIAFLGLCALLVVGIAMLVSLAPTPSPVSSKALAVQEMPDGTLLVLEQVTVGTRHQFEHSWSEPERPFDWLLGSGPTKYVEDDFTFKEQQMLWFTRHDPKTGQSLDFDWWGKCLAIDEHGWEVEDENPGRIARTATGSSSYSGSRPLAPVSPEPHRAIVAHSSLPRFRCRAPTYRLKVFDTSGAAMAEFDVPSPAFAGIPEWVPEPLPVTKTDRDLSVTLTALAVQSRQSGGAQESGRPELSLEPKLEVRWNDNPTTSWASSELRLSDALGNTGSAWECRLNPFESAWKLTIRLFRSNPADLDPSEQLVVENVELPPPETVRALGQTLTVGPVTLDLTAIGTGKVKYTEADPSHSNGSWGSSGTFGPKSERFKIEQIDKDGVRTMTVDTTVPHLRYHVSGLDPDYRLQVRVLNDQGTELFGSFSTFDKTNILLLPEPGNSKAIRIMATIQAVRKVEFLVLPPEEFRAPWKKDGESAK